MRIPQPALRAFAHCVASRGMPSFLAGKADDRLAMVNSLSGFYRVLINGLLGFVKRNFDHGSDDRKLQSFDHWCAESLVKAVRDNLGATPRMAKALENCAEARRSEVARMTSRCGTQCIRSTHEVPSIFMFRMDMGFYMRTILRPY